MSDLWRRIWWLIHKVRGKHTWGVPATTMSPGCEYCKCSKPLPDLTEENKDG